MKIRTESSIHNSISSDQTYCCERMAECAKTDMIDFFINDSATLYPLPVKTTFKIQVFDMRTANDRTEHLQINYCPFCGEKIE